MRSERGPSAKIAAARRRGARALEERTGREGERQRRVCRGKRCQPRRAASAGASERRRASSTLEIFAVVAVVDEEGALAETVDL